MKILQINKFYHLRGGAERYMLTLSHLLEEHGHTVIPFAMQHPNNLPSPYQEYFVFPVDTHASPWSAAGIAAAARVLWSREAERKMEALILKTKPDIAHLHLIYHHLSPSILPVLVRHHIPIVMTLSDYKLICPNYKLYTQGSPCERCRGGKYYEATVHKCLRDSVVASALGSVEMYLHKMLKVYERSVDLSIAPSHFVRDEFVKFGQDGLKIRVLPYFLPTIPPSEKHGTREPLVLYVGRLSKEKGVDKFLEMVHALPSPWRIAIIGTGPEAASLQERFGKRSDVIFVGHVEGDALAAWYQRASIAIVPSQFFEPFGIVVIEALSYGVPVVASNRGALPEIIDHEKTGLIVPADDGDAWRSAITRLIQDERLRQSMGKNGRKVAAILYAREMHYTKLIEWYEELIGRKLGT
ncbi:MAG: glycosyltransferase family 4 protein [Candidatus Yonathbacteria bacterium]|nr:glycosyltransferase family 4 protein [Candidatus Yonathbacteria bacterium]